MGVVWVRSWSYGHDLGFYEEKSGAFGSLGPRSSLIPLMLYGVILAAAIRTTLSAVPGSSQVPSATPDCNQMGSVFQEHFPLEIQTMLPNDLELTSTRFPQARTWPEVNQKAVAPLCRWMVRCLPGQPATGLADAGFWGGAQSLLGPRGQVHKPVKRAGCMRPKVQARSWDAMPF